MSCLGSWNIDDVKSTNLPQKVQSAFTSVTGDLVGADYQPVLYVGKQIVNGSNYCVLAIRTLVTPQPSKRLVKMIIHEDNDGSASLISITGIDI